MKRFWEWMLCHLIGHDVHTFPGAPMKDFCGVYCIRCGTIWNVTDDGHMIRE